MHVRFFFCAALSLLSHPGAASTVDAPDRIRIQVQPWPQADSTRASRLAPPSDSIHPPSQAAVPLTPGLLHPPSGPPSLSMSLLRVHPLPDSLSPEAKAVAGFPGYWVQVEQAYGIDALRSQLGMNRYGGDKSGSWMVPIVTSDGMVYVNFLGLGSGLYNAWKSAENERTRQERFQSQVRGLMGMTREIQGRKGDSPAISIILAKLDFMGKRVKGGLPRRYDREIFTESLKAWAVNPVFDSTNLGPKLMELCRAYEEFDK
jgi:hypothetical protein